MAADVNHSWMFRDCATCHRESWRGRVPPEHICYWAMPTLILDNEHSLGHISAFWSGWVCLVFGFWSGQNYTVSEAGRAWHLESRMDESLCRFSLCISNGKASLLEDGFLPVLEHVGGVAGHGLHNRSTWHFLPRVAFSLRTSSERKRPLFWVLSSSVNQSCIFSVYWDVLVPGTAGTLRGHKISTCPVGIANNLTIMWRLFWSYSLVMKPVIRQDPREIGKFPVI